MSSTSADQSAGVDDITFPPKTSSVPAVNLASTDVDSSDDSNGPPHESEDASQRQEDQNYRRTHGSCMYYPTDDRHPCQMQRSCYDCLNFNITTEPEGCFVNPMGQCVSMSLYNAAEDYKLGAPSNDLATEFVTAGYNGTGSNSTEPCTDGQGNQQFDFPASEVTYCEQADPQCLLCRATVFANIIYHNSDDSRSRYCYGQNGCVCVAICEALDVNHVRPDKSCMVNAMAEQNNTQSTFNGAAAIGSIIGAMCFIVASVFVIYRIRTRGEQSSNDGGRNQNGGNRRGSGDDGLVITPDPGASPIATATPVMRAGSGSGLLLNLFGWTAMREVLIQKEQMQAAGVEDAALEPVKNNSVQLIGTHPSAPDVDRAVPTAPSAIPYATLAMVPTPIAITVRAMAAPSAPDFEDMDASAPAFEDMDSMDGDAVDDFDDIDDVDMTVL